MVLHYNLGTWRFITILVDGNPTFPRKINYRGVAIIMLNFNHDFELEIYLNAIFGLFKKLNLVYNCLPIKYFITLFLFLLFYLSVLTILQMQILFGKMLNYTKLQNIFQTIFATLYLGYVHSFNFINLKLIKGKFIGYVFMHEYMDTRCPAFLK